MRVITNLYTIRHGQVYHGYIFARLFKIRYILIKELSQGIYNNRATLVCYYLLYPPCIMFTKSPEYWTLKISLGKVIISNSLNINKLTLSKTLSQWKRLILRKIIAHMTILQSAIIHTLSSQSGLLLLLLLSAAFISQVIWCYYYTISFTDYDSNATKFTF